jgi:hypothetical protein
VFPPVRWFRKADGRAKVHNVPLQAFRPLAADPPLSDNAPAAGERQGSNARALRTVRVASDGRCESPGWLRSGDGPLSIRGCPSTVKGTRRSFLTASQKRSSGPTLERRSLCTPSGQKPRVRREPARTGRGPSPARCGSACYRAASAELTATVTATAAATGLQQRPATARNTRTIRANLGICPA